MRISECRVKILDQAPMCAIASITLDNQFVVKGIRILEIQNRLMVCMPSRRGPDGEHRDVAHPVNARVRQLIDSCVLATYAEERQRATLDPAGLARAGHDAADLGHDELEGAGLVAREAEDRSFCSPGG